MYVKKFMLSAFAAVAVGAIQAGVAEAQTYPPWYPPPYPSFPVFQSGSTITGLNSAGGIDTASTTVNNSFFDPYRQQSMSNGTLRPVNRPVVDALGQVTGWESGIEWYNPYTGQTHAETQTQTQNGLGGTETHTTIRYAQGRKTPVQAPASGVQNGNLGRNPPYIYHRTPAPATKGATASATQFGVNRGQLYQPYASTKSGTSWGSGHHTRTPATSVNRPR